jgi:hypothetical protein
MANQCLGARLFAYRSDNISVEQQLLTSAGDVVLLPRARLNAWLSDEVWLGEKYYPRSAIEHTL